jgi:hypothetical protein
MYIPCLNRKRNKQNTKSFRLFIKLLSQYNMGFKNDKSIFLWKKIVVVSLINASSFYILTCEHINVFKL